MSELLVVKAKIKDYAEGMNVSGDFAEGLSAKVEALIKDAVRRSKANGRKTIRPDDI